MEDNKQIKVKNRVNGTVVYVVPDMGNLRREFQGQQEKIVTFEELRKLSYTPGGMVLLKDYLVVKDREALEELNLDVEPEYFYNKDDVIKLLQTGSLDELLDCLDFAPIGIIDLVKEYAVTLPLNDVAKRQAIFDKTGFDVTTAINLQLEQLEATGKETKATKRRAAVPSKDGSDQLKGSSTGRRVSQED